ncbi:MAG: hypothetical protein ACRD3E_18235 [Terriglobales bacterium]
MKHLLPVLLLTLCISATAQTAKPSAGISQPAAATAAVAPAPTTAAASDSSDLALPPGTPVYMKLETPISTRTNKTGDRFAGRVTQPVVLNGKTIVPVGAGLEGTVMRAEEERRIHGTPVIDLRPETITMPDGTRYMIVANVVDTANVSGTSVDDEGRIHGKGRDGSDWKETGIGAGAGALVGGLAAGAKGSLIGAGVGATASVVHWLVKTRDADLPAGTEIIMELSRPMTLSASAAVGQ